MPSSGTGRTERILFFKEKVLSARTVLSCSTKKSSSFTWFGGAGPCEHLRDPQFERQLRAGLLLPPKAKKEVPLFSAYAEEFTRTYAAANNKPSEQHAKRRILRNQLLPVFGDLRLDQIKTREVETLKAELLTKPRSPQLVNNVVACLGKMLRYAKDIELIDTLPRLKLLRLEPPRFDFLTFDELSRADGAASSEPERHLVLLLGADAGLQQGEMIALEWGGVDLETATLTVSWTSWRGIVGTPKGRRERKIPLTSRLRAALRAHRHLRSDRVLLRTDGAPFTQSTIESALRAVAKRAGLRHFGSHVLRHTFCSHLAMRGAAPKAVQELAGYATLTMTLRYMHLAPGALREAIGLLEFGQPVGNARRGS